MIIVTANNIVLVRFLTFIHYVTFSVTSTG